LSKVILRRINTLELQLGIHQPNGVRSFTLEELCLLYWRMDKNGFQRMVADECPGFRLFANKFASEDGLGMPSRQRQATPK
jgi:hypothetical protein